MTALIVVDMQNDFVNGSLPVPRGAEIAPHINMYMRRHNHVKIASKDCHVDPGPHFDDYARHCVKGTAGADFFGEFDHNLLDHVVAKGEYYAAPSAFDGWERRRSLNELLLARNETEIEVCGLATDVCVLATCLDGIRLGFHTTMLVGLTAAIGGKTGTRDAVRQVLDAGGWVR